MEAATRIEPERRVSDRVAVHEGSDGPCVADPMRQPQLVSDDGVVARDEDPLTSATVISAALPGRAITTASRCSSGYTTRNSPPTRYIAAVAPRFVCW